jgi:hypothetical protein
MREERKRGEKDGRRKEGGWEERIKGRKVERKEGRR